MVHQNLFRIETVFQTEVIKRGKAKLHVFALTVW